MGIFDISSLPIRYPAPALELFQSRHDDVLRQFPHNAENTSVPFRKPKERRLKNWLQNTPLPMVRQAQPENRLPLIVNMPPTCHNAWVHYTYFQASFYTLTTKHRAKNNVYPGPQFDIPDTVLASSPRSSHYHPGEAPRLAHNWKISPPYFPHVLAEYLPPGRKGRFYYLTCDLSGGED